MKRFLLLAIASIALTGCIDRPDDSAFVIVSVSGEQLCYKEKCWEAYGNQFTPRGTYQIESPQKGRRMGFSDPNMFAMPFYTVASEDVSPENPMYDPNDRRPLAFSIHEDNRSAGAPGAGCLLVSREAMIELMEQVPGATIIIED